MSFQHCVGMRDEMRTLSEVLTRRSGRQSRAASPLSFQEDTHHKEGSSSNRGAVACASIPLHEHKRHTAALSASTHSALSAEAANRSRLLYGAQPAQASPS